METRTCTREELEHLALWQSAALDKMPYFSTIMFALRPLSAPGLGTVAVDAGFRLYLDFGFLRGLSTDQAGQALLHECGHVWRRHFDRARECHVTPGEARVSNIASDAELNDDLVEAGCSWIGEHGVTPGKIGEADFQEYETYLNALRTKMAQQQTCPSCGAPEAAGSGGEPSESDCADCGATYAGCGSGAGGPTAPCELPAGDDLDGAAVPATEAEVDSVLARTADAIVSHSKGRGSVPGGLLEQAELVLAPPQVHWSSLLGALVRRSLARQSGRRRSTHTKRSRRRHNIAMGSKKVIYPGRYSPKLNVLVVRDTSGSMSPGDLNAAGSEIVGVSKAMGVRGPHLLVMDVDHVVHEPVGYTDVTSLTQIKGRGGTDMRLGIDAAAQMDRVPDVVLVLTDGYTPWPDQPYPFPVIACIIGAESMATRVPDWMGTVVIEPGQIRHTKAA